MCFIQAERTPEALAAMAAEEITARIGPLEAEIASLRARLQRLNEAEAEAAANAGADAGNEAVA